MKFLTALGLAAGGASKTIQEGLDREQKEKDREARSAEAAAGRQHTTDLLYKRRRFDQMDKLVEVQEALFALGLNEQQVAANMSGGMANVERLQNLKTISSNNNLDFGSSLNVTFGENFSPEDIEGGAVNYVQSNLLDARLEGKVYKNPYRTEISDQLKALESIGDPVGFKKQIENQYNSIYRLEQLIDKGTNVEQNQKLVNQKRDLITELTKKYVEMEQTTGNTGLLTSGYMSLALRKVKDAKKGAFGELIETSALGAVTKKFTGNYGRAFEAYLTSIDGIQNEIQAYSPDNPNAISGGSAAFMNELTLNANTQLINEYNLEYLQRIRLGAERDRTLTTQDSRKPMEISLLNPLSDTQKNKLKAGDVVKHIVNNQPVYEIFRGFAEPNQSNPTGIQFFRKLDTLEIYNPQQ